MTNGYDVIVQQHGSRLEVISEVGDFTEFVLELSEQTATEA